LFDIYVLRRLLQGDKLYRVLVERLTEPLHLNIISLPIWLSGSFRAKVAFDLVVRQQYAFSILLAADRAKEFGNNGVTIVELGVAAGAGLINMCKIADQAAKATGIDIHVVGFDTGTGMPPPQDYRDYPEAYRQGDFPMDVKRLRNALPANAELIIGDITKKIPAFLENMSSDYPIGFVAVDVDYYSSAKQALAIFRGDPHKYLPRVAVHLDDIGDEFCNAWTGELLAIDEFNCESEWRKIAPFPMLRSRRVFKNARWIDHLYIAHIHDHEMRSAECFRAGRMVAANEYIS
jgi:hypothetical protein